MTTTNQNITTLPNLIEYLQSQPPKETFLLGQVIQHFGHHHEPTWHQNLNIQISPGENMSLMDIFKKVALQTSDEALDTINLDIREKLEHTLGQNYQAILYDAQDARRICQATDYYSEDTETLIYDFYRVADDDNQPMTNEEMIVRLSEYQDDPTLFA